jgi:NADH dehydrogenase
MNKITKKIVIVGGGFGGISAATRLARDSRHSVTLIDRRNFHLFQPLLYQVAMAGLNPGDIATPFRSLFRKKKNVEILLAEVDDIDLKQNRIHFDSRWLSYDYLVLACGAKHAYFGHEEWEEAAPGLKNLEQAIEIRRRILTAFEIAEKTQDSEVREQHLTFVIVGGGPTGVELAGAIAEMASYTLVKDFKNADLTKTKVILVEAGPRVLPSFPPKLSAKAQENLESLGVEVLLNARASELSKAGLNVGERFIAAHTILWAAGVLPSSLSQKINVNKDKFGRPITRSDLSLADFPNVFVIGDQASVPTADGSSLPGIAPVAIQQGNFLEHIIRADHDSQPRPTFKYWDKGIMATIGRSKAVVCTGPLQFSGWLAWIAWVFIHILYLMKFRNRFFVFLQWAWAYFTFGHGARLITHKTWRFYSGEKISLK